MNPSPSASENLPSHDFNALFPAAFAQSMSPSTAASMVFRGLNRYGVVPSPYPSHVQPTEWFTTVTPSEIIHSTASLRSPFVHGLAM